jgi:hypothetical protein
MRLPHPCRFRVPSRPHQGGHPVTIPRFPFLPGRAGRARPTRRLRLLAAVAAPLALAGTALPAAAAVGSPPSHAQPARAAAASAGGPQAAPGAARQLALPGLHQASYMVTLITGDQVRLTQTSPGRYTASAVPGQGTGSQILLRSSFLHGQASLQAIPGNTGQLLASGKVNQDLFDVTWLAGHGDAGPRARIPATIAYRGHPAATSLRQKAATLPGASVLAASPATGQVRVTVAAARAGAFWAALTGTTPAGAVGPPASRLAAGARAVWLTGHDTTAANPQPQAGQAGQPTYPVTITYTRTIGPLGWLCNGITFVAPLCLDFGPGFVLGLAGAAQDQIYQPSGPVCAHLKPGRPLPVCTSYRLTYQLPAGIYYSQQMGEFDTTSDSDHALESASVDMDIPQFTVTGPTALTVNANNAVPVTVRTPQPASVYNGVPWFSRNLGPLSVSGAVYNGAAAPVNFWAVPTPPADRATLGSYTVSDQLTLGAPPVTAHITAPALQALPVVYPTYESDYTNTTGETIVNRFSGSQSLQLVDAGLGTAADFAKINAKGKLVLINDVPLSCAPFHGFCKPGDVDPPQIANAQKAGAAGVLFNAGYNCLLLNGTPDCTTEINRFTLPREWFTNGGTANLPDLPFAEISFDQAAMLRGLLAKGPVTISITDHGESPYLYNLAFFWEGGIPASLTETVTSRDLAAVTTRYHDTQVKDVSVAGRTLPHPDEAGPGGALAPVNWGPYMNLWLPPRSTRVEYYGPLSPSAAWWQYEFDSSGDVSVRYSIFNRPGPAGTQDWNETPVTPGADQPGTAVLRAISGTFMGSVFGACSACREGSIFYPVTEGVNGADPQAISAAFAFGGKPADVHLYNQVGKELSDSPIEGFAAYRLPPGQAAYKLVDSPPGGATYTWGFTSAKPTTDHTPLGTECLGTGLGLSAAPCQAAPLVFLRYNAYTSLANTITAPGRHQLQVAGYHQDPTAPAVTSLKLWTSADGGKTWQQAHLTGGHAGNWTAAYTLPALPQTDGYLSIKAQATDAAGNAVSETIPDMVKLAAPASGPATPHRY